MYVVPKPDNSQLTLQLKVQHHGSRFSHALPIARTQDRSKRWPILGAFPPRRDSFRSTIPAALLGPDTLSQTLFIVTTSAYEHVHAWINSPTFRNRRL